MDWALAAKHMMRHAPSSSTHSTPVSISRVPLPHCLVARCNFPLRLNPYLKPRAPYLYLQITSNIFSGHPQASFFNAAVWVVVGDDSPGPTPPPPPPPQALLIKVDYQYAYLRRGIARYHRALQLNPTPPPDPDTVQACAAFD